VGIGADAVMGVLRRVLIAPAGLNVKIRHEHE
jgi:hypothetical protein